MRKMLRLKTWAFSLACTCNLDILFDAKDEGVLPHLNDKSRLIYLLIFMGFIAYELTNIRLSLHLWQQLPSPSKFFGNLCIVFVGSHFNNLSSFQL